ncbi:MAG TPA: hypothetical protein GXZ28_01700 [Clostridiales bacterium]|jgi:hypothetical protein|nr:hypothetical protein [Clostridiales bacterium]
MKKLYEILKAILWLNIGAYIGNIICEYSYRVHYPDIFTVQSAPWYVAILPHTIFAIILTIILVIGMVIIQKKQ